MEMAPHGISQGKCLVESQFKGLKVPERIVPTFTTRATFAKYLTGRPSFTGWKNSRKSSSSGAVKFIKGPGAGGIMK